MQILMESLWVWDALAEIQYLRNKLGLKVNISSTM